MKHALIRICAALCLAAVTVSIAAGVSANVSWLAPLIYTDQSPVQAGDIDHYLVTWSPAQGQLGPSGSTIVAGNTTSTTVPVPCGATSFTITVFTTATAKYPNVTGGPTAPVAYASGVTCTINPPTGLVVH